VHLDDAEGSSLPIIEANTKSHESRERERFAVRVHNHNNPTFIDTLSLRLNDGSGSTQRL
jgi:hypothetical protein